MKFNYIDFDSFPRKEHFQHYHSNVKCSYSLTVNIDITQIYNTAKEKGKKLYPSLIWWLSNGVNTFDFMRFEHDSEGRVGFYDAVNPSFTVMPKNSENFASLWCEYSPDFEKFYQNCTQIMDCYKDTDRFAPQTDRPANCFDISSLPWIDFTAFNLNLHTSGTWLLPIFTTGRLIKQNDKVLIPLAIQVHHAVCDGWYCAKFIDYIQKKAQRANMWIK